MDGIFGSDQLEYFIKQHEDYDKRNETGARMRRTIENLLIHANYPAIADALHRGNYPGARNEIKPITEGEQPPAAMNRI